MIGGDHDDCVFQIHSMKQSADKIVRVLHACVVLINGGSAVPCRLRIARRATVSEMNVKIIQKCKKWSSIIGGDPARVLTFPLTRAVAIPKTPAVIARTLRVLIQPGTHA